jgi:WD40 repeat protein
LCYSGNYKWLAAVDQDAKAHVWEVQNEYKETVLPGSFPKGTIISIDSNNIAVIASFQKVSFWDLSRQELRRVWDVAPGKVADNDAQGNILILDFNQCTRYNALQKSADFVLQHPEWPLPDVDDSSKVYHIPYHMQLTAARFAGAHIYSAGIDRTICVWDLSTGKLERTLTGHKGTISKLKVSGGGKQVVSVDLKGGIRFWEVE